MFFSTRRNVYDTGDGPIRHLDGSALARPLEIPRQHFVIVGALVVVAAILGTNFLVNTFSNFDHSNALSQATVEENLSRPPSLQSLPLFTGLIGASADDIKTSFENAGYTIFDKGALSNSEDSSIDFIKLPDDVSAADAIVLYQKGISSLSASEASRLLNGSWEFTKTSNSGEIKIKYADFTSGGIDAAIASAMAAEGFDEASASSSGTDSAGNTYKEGRVGTNDGSHTWRVSVIALSSVYTVNDLPDTSLYVGISFS